MENSFFFGEHTHIMPHEIYYIWWNQRHWYTNIIASV